MNTTRWGLLAIALGLIAVSGAVVLILVPAPKSPLDVASSTTTASTTEADLQVDSMILASTSATIAGKARGTWYFEASFPVQILNAAGAVIAQTPAQAQSDWMTTDFVAFKATLTYPAQPAGSHGTVVLKNDNPSGDPARQKSVEIPVTF